MENTTTIAGNNYKIGKMDAFDQFHVARRLAPALFALGGAASSMRGVVSEDGEQPSSLELEGAMLSAFEPVAQALAGMSDADTEYVLNKCLAIAMREQGNAWQKVAVMSGGKMRLMFQDIDMPVMVQLAVMVIKENLGNFFTALPGSFQPAPTSQA